jgi:hypothetical protein
MISKRQFFAWLSIKVAGEQSTTTVRATTGAFVAVVYSGDAYSRISGE